MPQTLSQLSDLKSLPFDQIIDARSPAEYAEDHIPGAVNMPSLSNDERAVVGTIYVRESRFRARKVGAAMVARNIAAHLEGQLAERDGGWRPLVYCWRGGQRSGAFASYLSQVGWRADTIEGGYKSYRTLVARNCYETTFAPRVILLDGHTGTAKTDLLHLLAGRGVQVLDLEGAANHRGSAFGARAGGQPSQKHFEGVLAEAMEGFDPSRPVVIEAESSKVGARIVAPTIWAAMKVAPRIRIVAPIEARADYLTGAYADLWANPAGLAAGLAALEPMHSGETMTRWRALTGAGNYRAFTEELMVQHYDARYGKARAQDGTEVVTERLDPVALDALAGEIEARLSGL
jgi:tRNA 2-selenouridine synthase